MRPNYNCLILAPFFFTFAGHAAAAGAPHGKGGSIARGTQFTGFTGTKVRILTQKALQEQRVLQEAQAALQVLILLALLVQKYKY
jgi:hypothetical protein